MELDRGRDRTGGVMRLGVEVSCPAYELPHLLRLAEDRVVEGGGGTATAMAVATVSVTV